MQYGITQPPGNGDFPAYTQPQMLLDLATPNEGRDKLTWVTVIAQDILPAKDGHLSQK